MANKRVDNVDKMNKHTQKCDVSQFVYKDSAVNSRHVIDLGFGDESKGLGLCTPAPGLCLIIVTDSR